MTEFVLVDTDVISYIFRGDSRAAAYERHLVKKLKALSVQTYGELAAMPLLNSWAETRKTKLYDFLEDYLVIEADKDVAIHWATIRFQSVRSGKPIATADAWIAATALAYSIPLVTNNYKDFMNIKGLDLITLSQT